MIIGSKQKKIGIYYLNWKLEQTQYIKYLGMYIDRHITWEQQIKHVKAKIAKNTGIINKLRYHLDLTEHFFIFRASRAGLKNQNRNKR